MNESETTTSTDLVTTLNRLAEEFDEFCRDRNEMGAEQYGPLAFLKNDMVEFLAEELADMCNYAKMMYIKIRLFEAMYGERLASADRLDSSDSTPPIGQQNFVSSSVSSAPEEGS